MEQRVLSLLNRFISGDDRSPRYADEVCGFLIQHYYDDDRFLDLIHALDLYDPSGANKEFGYTLEMVLRECRQVIARLAAGTRDTSA